MSLILTLVLSLALYPMKNTIGEHTRGLDSRVSEDANLVSLVFLSVGDFRLRKIEFDTDISLISCSLSNEEHYWRTYPRLRFKGE